MTAEGLSKAVAVINETQRYENIGARGGVAPLIPNLELEVGGRLL